MPQAGRPRTPSDAVAEVQERYAPLRPRRGARAGPHSTRSGRRGSPPTPAPRRSWRASRRHAGSRRWSSRSTRCWARRSHPSRNGRPGWPLTPTRRRREHPARPPDERAAALRGAASRAQHDRRSHRAARDRRQCGPVPVPRPLLLPVHGRAGCRARPGRRPLERRPRERAARPGGRGAPLRMPDIVWRAGIDLAPLDAARRLGPAVPHDPRLAGRGGPGSSASRRRSTSSRPTRPRSCQGDATDPAVLAAMIARAPRGCDARRHDPRSPSAHPARRSRQLIATLTAAAAVWITIDPPALHEAWHPAIDTAAWDGFVLARDGHPLAAVDPLGAFVEWRPQTRPSRG